MTLKLLTKETAWEYHLKAVTLGDDLQDAGDRRALRMELQREYGLSELEAVNILNWRNVKDILWIVKQRVIRKEVKG